jgi:ABC-type transport system involved in multi-copper enzyme maturation permease subunit
MTDTMIDKITPYRSAQPSGRDGLAQLLRAEWTKFRSVRGWLIAAAVAALLMVLVGILTGVNSHSTYDSTPDNPNGIVGHPYVPIGPEGEAVTDHFYFVHQPLDGDGTITVRVTSLTGTSHAGPVQVGTADQTPDMTTGGVQPWTKAGIIVKANTSQGSQYAAIMVTGTHGVRMQYNYTGDIAGPAGTVSTTSPRWLRLTRTGSTVTGYASTDGTTWTTVGAVQLSGLPETVAAGMFVASPDHQDTSSQHLGGGSGAGGRSIAAARFDTLDLQGRYPNDAWTGGSVGDSAEQLGGVGFHASGGTFTVTGSGDIAPDAGQSGNSVESTLVGAFATLTVMIVLGVLFVSAEYRRGLIRTSLTVSPRRGRVLAAKAIIIGAVTFVTGLIGAVITIPISEHLLRENGNFMNPIAGLTEVRVVAGTAALLAIAAVLAVAVGTILRRSAAAVAAVIVIVVLPYILATAAVLSSGLSQWLLRITPAAAFAIQQSIPAYHQVDRAYTPLNGFYPLAPWVGFAVLCAWTTVALGVASYLLRRRDA